jgi:hypothetical protein
VTPSRMIIFGAAGVIAVLALALALWPIEGGSAVAVERPATTLSLGPVALVGDARARADRLGSRFQIGGAIVAQSDATAEQPPRVVGLVRAGRRAFAYVDGAEGPRRLTIGATYGGWRLVGVSGNAATFDTGGRREIVRLFQEADLERSSGKPAIGTAPSIDPIQPPTIPDP